MQACARSTNANRLSNTNTCFVGSAHKEKKKRGNPEEIHPKRFYGTHYKWK